MSDSLWSRSCQLSVVSESESEPASESELEEEEGGVLGPEVDMEEEVDCSLEESMSSSSSHSASSQISEDQLPTWKFAKGFVLVVAGPCLEVGTGVRDGAAACP